MVRDGFYYAGALLLVAVFIGWMTIPALAVVPLLLAAFFLWFFLGTAVYLLPKPLLGFLGRWDRLRLVARFAVGLMGAYYLYAGLLLIIRGTQWLRVKP